MAGGGKAAKDYTFFEMIDSFMSKGMAQNFKGYCEQSGLGVDMNTGAGVKFAFWLYEPDENGVKQFRQVFPYSDHETLATDTGDNFINDAYLKLYSAIENSADGRLYVLHPNEDQPRQLYYDNVRKAFSEIPEPDLSVRPIDPDTIKPNPLKRFINSIYSGWFKRDVDDWKAACAARDKYNANESAHNEKVRAFTEAERTACRFGYNEARSAAVSRATEQQRVIEEQRRAFEQQRRTNEELQRANEQQQRANGQQHANKQPVNNTVENDRPAIGI